MGLGLLEKLRQETAMKLASTENRATAVVQQAKAEMAASLRVEREHFLQALRQESNALSGGEGGKESNAAALAAAVGRCEAGLAQARAKTESRLTAMDSHIAD